MKATLVAFLSATLITTTISERQAPVSAAGAATFSASQAALGAKAYLQNCASCHGTSLQGETAPALVGKTSGIAQQSVTEVYEYESQQMPMLKPGALSKAQYLGILAYLLQQNGHKPGKHALTEAAATTSSTTMRVR